MWTEDNSTNPKPQWQTSFFSSCLATLNKCLPLWQTLSAAPFWNRYWSRSSIWKICVYCCQTSTRIKVRLRVRQQRNLTPLKSSAWKLHNPSTYKRGWALWGEMLLAFLLYFIFKLKGVIRQLYGTCIRKDLMYWLRNQEILIQLGFFCPEF